MELYKSRHKDKKWKVGIKARGRDQRQRFGLNILNEKIQGGNFSPLNHMLSP